MALFHRREKEHSEILYTIGTSLEKTKLIVGLGNVGSKYDLTRHNIGFYCLDNLLSAENGSWSEKKSLKSETADIRTGSTRLILCKPTTYMNLSGEAVQAVQKYFKIKNSDTIVIHDDLDIAFGQIRTRIGGSSAGNNGIKSLIHHLGEDFGRVRIGIGNEFSDKIESADFVLQKFSKPEQESLKLLSNEVISIINEASFGSGLISETRTFL
jgi:PTH1 family peptidyl-tRNA hydrolase